MLVYIVTQIVYMCRRIHIIHCYILFIYCVCIVIILRIYYVICIIIVLTMCTIYMFLCLLHVCTVKCVYDVFHWQADSKLNKYTKIMQVFFGTDDADYGVKHTMFDCGGLYRG